MKIKDLQDPTKELNIDLKIIWDKSSIENKWGHKIKTVIVVDADSEQSSESALLDLFDGDIDKYSFKDKIRVVNGYAKLSKNKRNQFRIGYGFIKGKLVGHYEKIEDEHT